MTYRARPAFLVCLFLLSALAFALPEVPPASGASPSHSPFHVGGGARRGVLGGPGIQTYPGAEPLYHDGLRLVCSDCHVMHASQSHAYNSGSPAPGEEVPYSEPAHPYLLKAADPLDLCLSCHDGQTFAPDVVGADANGLTQRSAGHFDDPEVANPRGHDLGRGLPPAPEDYCIRCHFGDGTQVKVTCIDCHDPHGNGVARNLQWASYPEGTPDLGLLTNPAASGMQRYEASNVAYGTLDSPLLREVNNMCIDCHHVYSGGWYVDEDGDGIHERHPVYDSERGSMNDIAQGQLDGGSAPAHWEAGTGSGFNTPRVRFMASGATDFASATVVDAETNGVFCLSCHYAHGSSQAFGLAWVPNGADGRTGCDQCHAMGEVPFGSPKPGDQTSATWVVRGR